MERTKICHRIFFQGYRFIGSHFEFGLSKLVLTFTCTDSWPHGILGRFQFLSAFSNQSYLLLIYPYSCLLHYRWSCSTLYRYRPWSSIVIKLSASSFVHLSLMVEADLLLRDNPGVHCPINLSAVSLTRAVDWKQRRSHQSDHKDCDSRNNPIFSWKLSPPLLVLEPLFFWAEPFCNIWTSKDLRLLSSKWSHTLESAVEAHIPVLLVASKFANSASGNRSYKTSCWLLAAVNSSALVFAPIGFPSKCCNCVSDELL